MAADVAVVVCEPDVEKALALAPLLHFLDKRNIPHMLFINKMDTATTRVRDVLQALQSVSDRPLVLRHVPIRDGDTSPAMSTWSPSAPTSTSPARRRTWSRCPTR